MMSVINVNKNKGNRENVALIRINLYLIYYLCSADCLITLFNFCIFPRPQVNMTFMMKGVCEDFKFT